jgi:hypothetical protein
VFHGLLVYPLVQHLSGFRWSKANLTIGLALIVLTAGVLCGFYLLSPLQATVLGLAITLLTSIYSIWRLTSLVSMEAIWRSVRQLLERVGLVRPGSRTAKRL